MLPVQESFLKFQGGPQQERERETIEINWIKKRKKKYNQIHSKFIPILGRLSITLWINVSHILLVPVLSFSLADKKKCSPSPINILQIGRPCCGEGGRRGSRGWRRRRARKGERKIFKAAALQVWCSHKNSPAFKILCVSLGARHFWDGAFVAPDEFRLKCKRGDGQREDKGREAESGTDLEGWLRSRRAGPLRLDGTCKRMIEFCLHKHR